MAAPGDDDDAPTTTTTLATPAAAALPVPVTSRPRRQRRTQSQNGRAEDRVRRLTASLVDPIAAAQLKAAPPPWIEQALRRLDARDARAAAAGTNNVAHNGDTHRTEPTPADQSVMPSAPEGAAEPSKPFRRPAEVSGCGSRASRLWSSSRYPVGDTITFKAALERLVVGDASGGSADSSEAASALGSSAPGSVWAGSSAPGLDLRLTSSLAGLRPGAGSATAAVHKITLGGSGSLRIQVPPPLLSPVEEAQHEGVCGRGGSARQLAKHLEALRLLLSKPLVMSLSHSVDAADRVASVGLDLSFDASNSTPPSADKAGGTTLGSDNSASVTVPTTGLENVPRQPSLVRRFLRAVIPSLSVDKASLSVKNKLPTPAPLRGGDVHEDATRKGVLAAGAADDSNTSDTGSVAGSKRDNLGKVGPNRSEGGRDLDVTFKAGADVRAPGAGKRPAVARVNSKLTYTTSGKRRAQASASVMWTPLVALLPGLHVGASATIPVKKAADRLSGVVRAATGWGGSTRGIGSQARGAHGSASGSRGGGGRGKARRQARPARPTESTLQHDDAGPQATGEAPSQDRATPAGDATPAVVDDGGTESVAAAVAADADAEDLPPKPQAKGKAKAKSIARGRGGGGGGDSATALEGYMKALVPGSTLDLAACYATDGTDTSLLLKDNGRKWVASLWWKATSALAIGGQVRGPVPAAAARTAAASVGMHPGALSWLASSPSPPPPSSSSSTSSSSKPPPSWWTVAATMAGRAGSSFNVRCTADYLDVGCEVTVRGFLVRAGARVIEVDSRAAPPVDGASAAGSVVSSLSGGRRFKYGGGCGIFIDLAPPVSGKAKAKGKSKGKARGVGKGKGAGKKGKGKAGKGKGRSTRTGQQRGKLSSQGSATSN